MSLGKTCEHTFICDYCISCGAYYISNAVKEIR